MKVYSSITVFLVSGLFLTIGVFVWIIPVSPEVNLPPSKPSDPNVSDGSVGVTLTPVLTWKCDDPNGDLLTYDLFFGTTEVPPLVVSDLKVAMYVPDALKPNTTYYWRVVVRDRRGGTTSGNVWCFITGAVEGGKRDE